METPIVIDGATFADATYEKAVLYVPEGCKSAYEAAENWNRFKEIVELGEETTGIVEERKSVTSAGQTYNLLGKRMALPQRKGIYIKNGKKHMAK